MVQQAKKKVLIVNDYFQYGGSDLVAVRLGNALESQKFDVTYCVRRSKPGPMEHDVALTGARIIHQPDDTLSITGSYKYFKKLFTRERFDIVHCHTLFFSGIVLKAAYECDVPVRAAHAHFSVPHSASYPLFKKIPFECYHEGMRVLLQKFCNRKIACSKEAGELLYGKQEFLKNGIVLNNPIDAAKYAFNPKARQKIRQSLNISPGTVLLGHVGHLDRNKNQSFLIRVFTEFLKINSNSKLVLIGDGEDHDLICDKIKSPGLEGKIILAGEVNNVNEYMSAMDCFVFPSLNEGFPLTLIEAQAAKLPCVVSSSITRETRLSNAIDYISLSQSETVWARKISAMLKINREGINNRAAVDSFDLKPVARELEKIYLGGEMPKENNFKKKSPDDIKFSVIVPVYNVEKYLTECVNSILCQTHKNFELILVDDGSPDNSGKMCDDFEKKDNRIKVIHKKNGGQSSARNAGLDTASGDFVIFIDSDDYWNSPKCLEILAKTAVAGGSDIVMFGCTDYNETTDKTFVSRTGYDKNIFKTGTRDEVLHYLLSQKKIPGGPIIFCTRRSIIEQNNIRFKEGVQNEDHDYILSVFFAGNKISALDNPFYTYRHRDGSTTGTGSVKQVMGAAYTVQKWIPVSNDIKNPVIRNDLRNYIAFIVSTAFVITGKLKKKSKSEYKEALKILNSVEYALKFSYYLDVRLNYAVLNFFGTKITASAAAKAFKITHSYYGNK